MCLLCVSVYVYGMGRNGMGSHMARHIPLRHKAHTQYYAPCRQVGVAGDPRVELPLTLGAGVGGGGLVPPGGEPRVLLLLLFLLLLLL